MGVGESEVRVRFDILRGGVRPVGSSRVKGRGLGASDGMTTDRMWKIAMEYGKSPQVSAAEVAGLYHHVQWNMDLGLGLEKGTWRGFRMPDGRPVKVRIPDED